MAIRNEISAGIAKYLTIASVAETLKSLPPVTTPVMDMVYPQSRRRQKASVYIALADIEGATGAIPIVRNGSRSLPLDYGSTTGRVIEPQAFNPSKFIKASELNQLLSLGAETGLQAFVRDTIEELRNRIRRSAEILAAQSLRGAISYPMQNEAGAASVYEIDYGAIQSGGAPLDISAMNYGQLRNALEEVYVKQQNTGYAGKIRFLAGSDVYSAVVNIVTSKSAIPAKFEADGLVIEGKYHILPFGCTYKEPGAAEATSVISANYIQSIDLDAPHTLFYAAIDDLDANMAPMPFFARHYLCDDPSGVKIIAHSKPVPAPVIKAMVRRQLLP
jgi:hypothetical protein